MKDGVDRQIKRRVSVNRGFVSSSRKSLILDSQTIDQIAALTRIRNKADAIKKSSSSYFTPTNVLLRGTKVISGKGAYVVIGVGKNSSVEKIEQKIKAENENASVLKRKIDSLEKSLSKIGVISAILTLACLVARLFYDLHRSGEKFDKSVHIVELIKYLMISVGVVESCLILLGHDPDRGDPGGSAPGCHAGDVLLGKAAD